MSSLAEMNANGSIEPILAGFEISAVEFPTLCIVATALPPPQNLELANQYL